ncbi:U-box domain-containing protein 9-like [Rhododendron vialii]|uniref:U-box domain-containing protein 9-like n=1 Tax=Rhododendron vialii TaxID=182163 RepID=UPI00265F9843|nr:U-box domain-containing protein 9-like [Rhododendron vialii]
MMSSSLSDQKSSAKTLRQLTKQYPPFRDLFGNEAVSKLLEPLDVPGNTCPDLDPQLDIITTVFNILISNLLKNIIDSLLDNMMSSSLSDQKSSAKTLRQLTKQYPPFRDLFGNEAVSKLLEPLDVPDNACLDLDLQLDIITTVFNISLPDGNKKVVAENQRVIPLLINALRTGTSQTKSNAAAALLNLSKLNSNRTLIHESGALGPLIRLVGQGNSETMTDVCKAMYMLCWEGANTDAQREKAVSDGAVRVILRKVKDGAFLDLLFPVLATLSSLPSAAEEMRKMGAVACLLIIMERGDKDSNAVKSCAAILRNICSYNKDELKDVKQEEAANGTISSVALRGTQKGRKKRHWIV